MIEAYLLHSWRYPANSGNGAAKNGGRWNQVGTEAIYTAATRSLAALEIIVHYSTLPEGFRCTPVRFPDSLISHFIVDWTPHIISTPEPWSPVRLKIRKRKWKFLHAWSVSRTSNLKADWRRDSTLTAVFAQNWFFDDSISAVLSVPSSIIPAERNYILNPAHPQFGKIKFLASEPFYFDSRLKQSV